MVDDLFEKLSTGEPDRGDESEDNLDNIPPSSEEAEAYSPNDSELEATLKRLFPSFDKDEIAEIASFAQIVMLGDVFPDNFTEKVYLLVTALALKHDDDPKFDVIFTMTKIEGICQVGLMRKGRVEAVIVSGNAKETAEQENGIKAGQF